MVTRALQGETISGEERCVRRDGEDVPVLGGAAPLRDERGRISGAVVVFKDISALKQLQRLRDEWTAIIAHDLRQPVCAIVMQAAALSKSVADPAQKARVDHIRSAADRLTRMIADLLDASQIEACRLTLRPEAVDVPALCREAVARMVGELGDRARVDARGEVPLVQADPLRLEEIVANLLSNAAKYSFPGTAIAVAIEARGGEVVVSVMNQGEGISQEELPALFERFRRTEGARTSETRGIGLGLYIAKGLVEAHGGRNWAESVPGRSTTFCFTLPTRLAEPKSP
jgi:signal transduction histidine kinase